MHRIENDQLRDLLCGKVRAMSDEAIQTGGQVAAEPLEALGRLARLVDLCEVAKPPPRRKRWPMATALGITLLTVSILLFARVSETEIELDLALSELSFVLSREQMLTHFMPLSALGVSGLQEIQQPRARDRAAQILSASDGMEAAIRVSVDAERDNQGTLNLAPLTLLKGTQVWVRRTEVPHQYRLSLKGTELVFRADVSGPVRVGTSGAPVEQLVFLSPKSILLRPASGEVDLDLSFTGVSQGTFSPELSISDVSLFRIEELIDTERTLVRPVSTVLSGTLYLESLNGQARPLRPAEALHFNQSYGEIRTLRLHEDHVALNFHGHVGGMTSGWGESQRSLMPTYLEWLQARHGLSLLWGTTLYLFGLILGLVRWWGIQL